MSGPGRPRRAGESIEDLCRASHATRDHAVRAVDVEGAPFRDDISVLGVELS